MWGDVLEDAVLILDAFIARLASGIICGFVQFASSQIFEQGLLLASKSRLAF